MAKLLQGGTVLVHDNQDHVQAIKADLLIEGSTISKIEAGITASDDVEIINCTDKIISPGFIDTHHHVWQTLLKGRHGDHLLIDYFAPGNFTSALHTPEDIYWGQLGGCFEMLDVGTTTVVDHAHLNYSGDHTNAGIAATIATGLRSVFCYSATPRLKSWDPVTLHPLLPDWVMENFDELALKAPFGNGRVELGFAFDGLYLPGKVIASLFERVKAAEVKTITTHYVHTNGSNPQSSIELLNSHSLLSTANLFSHATNPTPLDASLLAQFNAHVSTTPSTELQMGMGESCAMHTTLPALHAQSSLGIDCHSLGTSSLPSEMRLLLQSSRAKAHQPFISAGKVPTRIFKTVLDAFNLGTVGGARAIHRAHDLGRLRAGYKADILIWDALSPSMICAAEQDPVSAIVLNSSPRDLDTVIVDGVVRKRDGRLLPAQITPEADGFFSSSAPSTSCVGCLGPDSSLEWKDVARMLLILREALEEKIKRIDLDKATEGIKDVFFLDKSVFVETL